jgi:hypothetical protein
MNNDNYNYDDHDDYLSKEAKVLIGYDFYTKEEVYSTDDYVKDKDGNLYLKENYIQANLDTNGEFISNEE